MAREHHDQDACNQIKWQAGVLGYRIREIGRTGFYDLVRRDSFGFEGHELNDVAMTPEEIVRFVTGDDAERAKWLKPPDWGEPASEAT